MTPLILLALVAGADEKVVLKEVGVALPAKVAGFQAGDRHTYETKELGYSVPFNARASKVTVYVYTAGVAGIPDGKAGDAVDDQLKRAAGDIAVGVEKGWYKNVRPMKRVPLPKPVTDAFAAAGYTYEVQGGDCKGYVLVAGRNGHFVKVRVTQFVVDGETDDAALGKFLETLAAAVAKPAQ